MCTEYRSLGRISERILAEDFFIIILCSQLGKTKFLYSVDRLVTLIGYCFEVEGKVALRVDNLRLYDTIKYKSSHINKTSPERENSHLDV
eukprot:snap_masked-scaffold_9-processed-gene-6.14-mRNA-1 protein AED:1.00 eAED:1.00 QI:0/-1/0/0/-1/1/1/0/89